MNTMLNLKIIAISACLLCWTVSLCSASVIPVAIIRRSHTVQYKDYPSSSMVTGDAYPMKHPVIVVPSAMSNLFVHFRTKSSQIHLNQVHKGIAGKTVHSHSEDEPHYLRHEVKKPVIQTVREVIVPYRQVIQEIKPVIEEIKTVVAAKQHSQPSNGEVSASPLRANTPVSPGVSKSTVYMNFGNNNNNYQNYENQNYGYDMDTNHGSNLGITYATDAHNVNTGHNSGHSSSYFIRDNNRKNPLYDLSSIYGINPNNILNIADNSHTSQSAGAAPDKPDMYNMAPVPVVYGMANDFNQNSEYSVEQQTYDEVNNGYAKTAVADVDPQNNAIYSYSSDDNHNSPVDYNPGHYYDMNNQYINNYLPNTEPQYYIKYVDIKNNDNPMTGYYTNANTNAVYDTGADYAIAANTHEGYSNGYSGEYSGDLAMSDGQDIHPMQSVSQVVPFFGQQFSKAETLGSALHYMPSIPFGYRLSNRR